MSATGDGGRLLVQGSPVALRPQKKGRRWVGHTMGRPHDGPAAAGASGVESI